MKKVTIYTRKQWRDFLRKNHKKEDKIALISYKKHTGKKSISHKEAMEEAICFGWIDTTIKRLDEERYQRYFVKRKENAGWSNNTISYAKDLIKRKLMTKAGLVAYERAKDKPTIDFNLPKNPDIPKQLEIALKKAKLFDKFKKIAPSTRKMHIRMLLRAKRPETKVKRIKEIINHTYNNS